MVHQSQVSITQLPCAAIPLLCLIVYMCDCLLCGQLICVVIHSIYTIALLLLMVVPAHPQFHSIVCFLGVYYQWNWHCMAHQSSITHTSLYSNTTIMPCWCMCVCVWLYIMWAINLRLASVHMCISGSGALSQSIMDVISVHSITGCVQLGK